MEDFNISRVITRNSFFRLLTYGVTLISTILYVRFVIKYLGIEVYGLWGLASLIISTSSIINFGFINALTKETAHIDGGDKNYVVIKFLLKGCDVFYILAGIITFPIIFGFRNSITLHIFGVKDTQGAILAHLIVAMVPLTIIYLSATSRRAVVEGFQEIHYASILALLGRLINFALSIILIFTGMGVWSLYTASFVENFTLLVAFSRKISIRLKNQKSTFYLRSKPRLRELVIRNLIYGFNIQISSIASIGLEFFYKVFITQRFGLESVGYFQVVWRAQQMLQGAMSSAMSPLFPASAFYIAKGNAFELKSLYKKSVKYAWLFAFGVFLIFIPFSGEILKLWIGQTSSFQIFTFQMLCAGVIFTSLATPAYMFILGSGSSEYITLTNVLSLFFSFISSFIFADLLASQLSWMCVGISYLLGATVSFTVIVGSMVKIFKWNITELLFSSLPSLRFIIATMFLGFIVLVYKLAGLIHGYVNRYIALLIIVISFLGLLMIEVIKGDRRLKNLMVKFVKGGL